MGSGPPNGDPNKIDPICCRGSSGRTMPLYNINKEKEVPKGFTQLLCSLLPDRLPKQLYATALQPASRQAPKTAWLQRGGSRILQSCSAADVPEQAWL